MRQCARNARHVLSQRSVFSTSANAGWRLSASGASRLSISCPPAPANIDAPRHTRCPVTQICRAIKPINAGWQPPTMSARHADARRYARCPPRATIAPSPLSSRHATIVVARHAATTPHAPRVFRAMRQRLMRVLRRCVAGAFRCCRVRRAAVKDAQTPRCAASAVKQAPMLPRNRRRHRLFRVRPSPFCRAPSSAPAIPPPLQTRQRRAIQRRRHAHHV